LSAIGEGKTTGITTTRKPLTTTSTPMREVLVTAAEANDANVRVGSAAIAADTGSWLAAGDAVRLRGDDLASVYVIAESGSQAVSYTYEYA
jgi:hypothetical protein